MSASGDRLKAGLEGPLSALGVDVEDVEVNKAGRRHVVRIVVDRDGGIDLDLVAAVSQRASELLDTEPLSAELPGPFVLEVTSPGVDRPLTETRHWRRAISRLVRVTMADGSQLDGRIAAVSADGSIDLSTDRGDVTIAQDEVQRAVVQVEFNRPGDAAAAEADADVDADTGTDSDDAHDDEEA